MAPSVTAVIPVRNMAAQLSECLAALTAAEPRPAEVIVVDDGSSDDAASTARRFGADVVRLEGMNGANAARNAGAERARGAILLFLDSDVVPSRSIVGDVVAAFEDGTLQAIVGSYAVRHRHAGLVSNYKNLWIRYSYHRSRTQVDWIFGAISAIRAEAFKRSGGFDGSLFMQNSGGDLELGKRIARLHPTIAFRPELEVEHLKRHTLASLLRNDLERSRSFVVMASVLGHLGRAPRSGFVNVYPAFIYGTALAWPLAAVLVLSAFADIKSAWAFAVGLLYLAFAAPFIAYVGRHRGSFDAIGAVGILFLDQLACAVGGGVGLVQAFLFRRRS